MPVRPRRSRVAKHALTLQDMMTLTVGPDDDRDLDRLRLVYVANRRRFVPSAWCVRYFDQGYDDRPVYDRDPANAADGLDVGCPGCD